MAGISPSGPFQSPEIRTQSPSSSVMPDEPHIRSISLHTGLPEGPLREIASDMRVLSWNIKCLGQYLAAQEERQTDWTAPAAPFKIPLGSEACTQAAMQSRWFAYWCAQLKVRPFFHRKLWEYAYISQVLWERDALQAGRSGLGFGCGAELLPSFFASFQVNILATDLAPDKVAGRGWAETQQHSASRNVLFYPQYLEQREFEKRVSLRYVDMNQIPADFRGKFDFTWSICALEHLGSIQHGLKFIRESVRCLKPGGIAVHTTEFNFAYETETLESPSCVLFRKKEFESLAAELRGLGHTVEPMNFDVGHGPLDGFVDVPPYREETAPLGADASYHPLHLKLMIDGFPSTCFGIIIKSKS
jgi:SAM-dependent methyltransferase